ncbi:hypothetical protein J6590_044083 [Homalodisca vitripennis]|nr:hypothetical protein J6590_044083 [Homalodisca vitripennis]
MAAEQLIVGTVSNESLHLFTGKLGVEGRLSAVVTDVTEVLACSESLYLSQLITAAHRTLLLK